MAGRRSALGSVAIIGIVAFLCLACTLAPRPLPWATLDKLRAEPILGPPPDNVEVYREEVGPNPVPF